MKKRAGIDREVTAKWRPQTRLVRGGTMRSEHGETSEAIFVTSGFSYDTAESAEARFDGREDGYTYSRQTNPTVTMFEERMALIEGAEVGKATATGMAAMTTALLAGLKAGDHVVGGRALFGSCRYLMDTLLPQFGIETTVVDGRDTEAWARAVRPNTRVFFFETPANPTLDIVDIRAIADIAHAHDIRVIVDNVFATPLLQKPLELGADIVCYSATKHIDGQGRCLGGMILCDHAFHDDYLYPFHRHTGPMLAPFEAWVLLKSLETLELRVTKMCENAAVVADHLAERLPGVRYPGRADFDQHELAMRQMTLGGSVVTMELPGGHDSAFRLMNALEIIDISNNIGDARTIITHPATTTHKAVEPADQREMGITPGMLRLSVGLEDARDLIADLDQAIEAAGG